MLPIGDDEERFESAKHPIAAPILGELHGRARHVPGITLELFLELLEQGHRIGGGAGETSEDRPAANSAHLLGVGLHHRVTHGHLSITAERDLAITPHRENGRRAHAGQYVCHEGKDSRRCRQRPAAHTV